MATVESTTKLTVTMLSMEDKRSSKSFDKISAGMTSTSLVNLANAYKKLTNAVTATAKRTNIEPLELG